MNKKGIIALICFISVVLIGAVGYNQWKNYELKTKISELITNGDKLEIAKASDIHNERIGDNYIRTYFKTEVQGVKEKLEKELISLRKEKSSDETGEAKIDKNIKVITFLGSEEGNSSLNSLTEWKIKKIDYHVVNGEIQLKEDSNLESIYFSHDNKAITLEDLFRNADTAKEIMINCIEAQLSSSEIDNDEQEKEIQSFKKLEFNKWSFAYDESKFKIRLNKNLKEKSEVEIPVSKLYSVINSDYLQAKDLENYQKYKVQRNKKVVAITFDDGPSRKTTPQALDILKKFGAKATFFMVGKNVKGNEDIIKRVLDEGHEIGNHSWNHPVLTKLSLEDAKEQINSTTKALKEAGVENVKIMRPPYGAINKEIKEGVEQAFIMWDVDTLDWKNKDTSSIMKAVKNTQSGSIILMHDIHQTTINALPKVLGYLKAQGYECVTVDELLGESLELHKSYHRRD